jgi:hypothetical protein
MLQEEGGREKREVAYWESSCLNTPVAQKKTPVTVLATHWHKGVVTRGVWEEVDVSSHRNHDNKVLKSRR